MDGILRCSRYSFGPNRLHYCGPDATREISAYIGNGAHDPGITALMQRFETLYPYLRLIAHGNHITDPFDDRVVEAYWIGNDLLETLEKENIYRTLRDELQLKKRLKSEDFDAVAEKLRHGGLPHHSFHVLNVWKRTGHFEREHTLESLNECRISWGTVLSVDGPSVTVTTEPLVYRDGNLGLGGAVQRTLVRPLEAEHDIEQLRVGDLITIHWGVPCEAITPAQAATLRAYTLRNIALANQTL